MLYSLHNTPSQGVEIAEIAGYCWKYTKISLIQAKVSSEFSKKPIFRLPWEGYKTLLQHFYMLDQNYTLLSWAKDLMDCAQ